MRMKSIEVRGHPPIKWISIDNLSDVIVLTAPNGVGKSRLIEGLIETFRDPYSRGEGSSIKIFLEATTDEERDEWKAQIIRTHNGDEKTLLFQSLQKNR